jgi:hypothetical protein
MSMLGSLGLGIPRLNIRSGTDVERVIHQRPLQRVLAFLGHTIHDVINDPVARNRVYGFYKLQRQVERGCEAVDLERWWNGRSLPQS